MNQKRLIEDLKTLLNIPSPSGDSSQAMQWVRKKLEAAGIQTAYTNKGALLATIEGRNSTKHRVLSAHVDTLGAMVREVKSNGRLKMTQIGGYPWNAVEGEYCKIATRAGKLYTGTILTDKASLHIHGAEAAANKRDENTMEVRIDESVSNEADVRALGIEVGDFIYFDPRVELTDSGYIKSRHLDDKACVACLLEVARMFAQPDTKPAYTTHFLVSNYEEVGHGANSGIPARTSEFIALDMAAPGPGQTSHEHKVTICAKDSSGPYDLQLRHQLTALAESEKVHFAVDIYPYYGSDASAVIRSGYDIRHGLIGPGVDASHAMERTHVDALSATVKLAAAYLKSDMIRAHDEA